MLRYIIIDLKIRIKNNSLVMQIGLIFEKSNNAHDILKNIPIFNR